MIICFNLGSSSIKASIFDNTAQLRKEKAVNYQYSDEAYLHIPSIVEELLRSTGKNLSDVSAFGVRVVHGGEQLVDTTLVTDEVINYLQSIQHLAPLHNPPAVKALQILMEKYSPIRIFAVFDTAFHQSMPNKARRYAIPPEWEEKYGVRRYGFHGLAHESMMDLYCETAHIDRKDATIITVQLGSGCSMCAIKNGVSIDTSMGFSPLEGLISRTRSGDIDPSVITYLSHQLHQPPDEIVNRLNHEAGMKGLTSSDGDMGVILEQVQQEDSQSQFAVELFIYRILKYVGAYDFVLGGAQAYVFGGGISEHTTEIIAGVFENNYFPVSLELSDHISLSPPITRMTRADSERHVYTAFIDEEKTIAENIVLTLTSDIKK